MISIDIKGVSEQMNKWRNKGIPYKQNISSSQKADSRFDIVMKEDSVIGESSMKGIPRNGVKIKYFYILQNQSWPNNNYNQQAT